jgi:DNA-binding NarL/FixJ family response regulator
MRVLLVGLPGERERLRAELAGATYEVVGEFLSIAAARASGLESDAILMALRQQDDLAPVEPLTARELEVLELVAEGRSNKAIAARLGISDQTVKFHVAAICGKLGAANRTDAVQRAIRRGLLSV